MSEPRDREGIQAHTQENDPEGDLKELPKQKPNRGIRSQKPDMTQEFEMAGVGKLIQVEDQVTSLTLQNQNLASRMTQIEMSMQELLHHVRNLSVKSEP